MEMFLFIVLFIAVYIALKWIGDKLVAWAARDPNKLVEGNERVKDLAFFAAIALVISTVQLITWAVQLIAWAVHLLV
jgi:small-conductance mechanosensitive channel